MSASPPGPLLNVGSGPANPPGWVNIDGSVQAWFAAHPVLARLAGLRWGRQVGHWPKGVVYGDVRRDLGFPAATVAAVSSSHFVEQLYRDEALVFLREAHRVLAPGGVCRIVVPDVAAIVDWYLERRRQPQPAGAEASSDVLMGTLGVHAPQSAPSRGFRPLYRRWTNFDSHKWMYDAEGLGALLRDVGFADPAPRKHLDSAIARDTLAAVERAERVDEGAGVCVEASR